MSLSRFTAFENQCRNRVKPKQLSLVCQQFIDKFQSRLHEAPVWRHSRVNEIQQIKPQQSAGMRIHL